MSKQNKEVIILIGLGLLCLSLWLYIWSNIFSVRDEFLDTYTGRVEYIWRWETLPVKIQVDPSLGLSKEELSVVAAHFNYFFQSRLGGDLIEFSQEAHNTAYLQLEKHFPKEVDAYTVDEGLNSRPTIYLDAGKYRTWSPLKRRGVIMHEIGHLLGLPHFEHHPQGLMRAVQKDPATSLTDVEQELLILLYSNKLGSKLIHSK